MLTKLVKAFNLLRKDVEVLTDDVKLIEKAKDGKDGKDGFSPDINIIAEEAAKLIPTPKDGVSPDISVVAEEAAKLIPEAKPGRDAIPPSIRDVADVVLANIERPKDGISPDIKVVAEEAAKLIPVPKDGTSPTPQSVAEFIPAAKPGKDGKDGVSVTKVKLTNNELFVFLDGVKKSAGKIKLPKMGPSFAPGAGGGGSLRTELSQLTQSLNNAVYLRSEFDLPNQTETTWEMDEFTPYILAANFKTNLQMIPANGSTLSGTGLLGFSLTYTGDLSMIKSVNVFFFYIFEIWMISNSSEPAFDISGVADTNGTFFMTDTRIDAFNSIGIRCTDEVAVQINCCVIVAIDGIDFIGQTQTILIDTLSIVLLSGTSLGIDLGVVDVTGLINLSKITMRGPVGAVGISGLINSGNIPVGTLGNISQCKFLGGMTDFTNLNPDNDTRWSYVGNSPTADTMPDALISFRGNITETVITDVDTPVLVTGVWTQQQASLFSTTAAGRVTWLAERNIKAPVTLSAGLISASGGSITVTVYVYVSGIQDTASGVPITISGSSAQTISIPWQLTLSELQFVEMYVENNSNTTNIIVESATLRVL